MVFFVCECLKVIVKISPGFDDPRLYTFSLNKKLHTKAINMGDSSYSMIFISEIKDIIK